MSDTNYESFYNGGVSSFDSNEGAFIGGQHHMSSYLGFPGSTQTANQLKEAVGAIKQGVKAFEVTMGVADTAEQIPKQNFEEMRALMKISGVRPSVHAPFTIDPAGFDQQKGYSDDNRKESERRFFSVLEKAKELNPDGNIPVVFHSSAGIPGNIYRPGDETKGEKRFHAIKAGIVNRETGEIGMIDNKKTFDPMHPEDFDNMGTEKELKEKLREANEQQWNQTMNDLGYFKRITGDVIGSAPTLLAEYKNVKLTEDFVNNLSGVQKEAYSRLQDANVYIQNENQRFRSAFNVAYKYGTDEQKQKLTDLSKEYQSEVKKSEGTILSVEDHRRALDNAMKKLEEVTYGSGGMNSVDSSKNIFVPKIYTSAEEFAKEKASETFGNLAWKSYDKLGGDKAPVLAIENMFPGMAFSRAEDMEDLIKASRDRFVKNAVDNGLNKSDAENAAKKLIGVTWDVGHLNIMKKEGFTDEDVVKATEKISPYVKHVHLTDNFGYSDSHLAPGMGNVPFKKILEELEKTGKLKDMSKIVEAPGFVQHFQRSPHGLTMAALGSPIYGAKMGPYWNQVVGMSSGGGYFGGPLAYLPEKHFSTYGSGFSSLPMEVGGQIPGTASRFSGTPNA